MIISYETLKTLFKCPISLQELTTLLTAQGLEVEAVYHNPPIEHFTTAQVVQRCDEGYIMRTQEADLTIPTTESLERDISYVLSNISGSWELATPESLNWAPSKKPLTVPGGLSIQKAWEWDDTLIELSITPNRGDCLSYLGVAREIFLGLRQPFDCQQWLSDIKKRYPVTYEDKTQAEVCVEENIARSYALMQVSCPRFESPFWLQRFLIKHGYQPKLPAVDVGHYFMVLLGLPSHAFDAAAFNGQVSLKYHDFETPYTWQGLQGYKAQLKGRLPVLMDENNQILCLPGVLGSAETAASTYSQRLLIEAAAFLPKAIRPMRAFAPVTASSLRFERGVWRDGQKDLLDLIAGMLCSFHPQVRCAEPLQSYQKTWCPPTLKTTRPALEKLTGRSFETEELSQLLNLMGVKVSDDEYEWQLPSWRFDLKIEQNFIGEIVRCYGLDRIQARTKELPPTPRRAKLSRAAIDPWIARGAQEVVTYSFVRQSWAYASGPTGCQPEGCFILQNPISDEMRVMRPSLLPSLCDLLSYHQRHQLDLCPLVEIAPTYHKTFNDRQRLRLSVAWPQKCAPRYWGPAPKEMTFYDIKGLLEGILPEGVEFVAQTEPQDSDKLLHPELQAQITLNGCTIGSFGLLNPRAAQQFDWPSAWLIDIDAEFDQKLLPPKAFQPFSKQPMVVRDWVFVIPPHLQAQDLVERVQSYHWPLCQQVRVFDFYIDPAGGERSVGIEVRFQAADRTLTEQDLQPLTTQIIADFAEHFGAKLKNFA